MATETTMLSSDEIRIHTQRHQRPRRRQRVERLPATTLLFVPQGMLDDTSAACAQHILHFYCLDCGECLTRLHRVASAGWKPGALTTSAVAPGSRSATALAQQTAFQAPENTMRFF